MRILLDRLLIIVNESDSDSIEYCIAERMINNIDVLGSLSIGAVAELCHISKSMLSKFVRSMGFDDYRDFKLEARLCKFDERDYKEDHGVNITNFLEEYGEEKYLGVLLHDIEVLFHTIDRTILDSLVHAIHKYKKIAAFGEIYSQTACINLQYKMSLYGKYVYTTFNDKKQDQYIRKADEDTLIIIFSNTGRYLNVYVRLDGRPEKTSFALTKSHVFLITSNEHMKEDCNVKDVLLYRYTSEVQNHPILYQLIIELIAKRYREIYY